MGTPGTVLLIELWGCDSKAVRDGAEMAGALRRACRKMGLGVVHSAFRRFETGGVGGFVTGYTGHIAVRGWPSTGYVMLDVYSCDEESDPRDALEVLVKLLGADRYGVMEVDRGRGDGEEPTVVLHADPEGGMLPPEAEHHGV